jgi:hypothetical protein
MLVRTWMGKILLATAVAGFMLVGGVVPSFAANCNPGRVNRLEKQLRDAERKGNRRRAEQKQQQLRQERERCRDRRDRDRDHDRDHRGYPDHR